MSRPFWPRDTEEGSAPWVPQVGALEAEIGAVQGFGEVELAATAVANMVEENMANATRVHAVRRPLRPFRRPFWLRFTYVTSVLVNKF